MLVEKELEAPRIHDLMRLYKLVSEHIDPIDEISMLKIINEAYIDSRYPGEMGLLPNGEPTLKEAILFCEFPNLSFTASEITLKLKLSAKI